MRSEYVVNVGNIGNIECASKKEARTTYLTYVADSKLCYGRASQEDVYLLLDGEPVQEFVWRNWRVEQQKAEVIRKRTAFEKALIILNRFLETDDDGN